MKHVRVSSFTLIELLVVIAIISVLASMLLPVLSSARGRALETVCMSQQRQLYVATDQYVGDHRGFYPRGMKPHGTLRTPSNWIWTIQDYLGPSADPANDKRLPAVFICPRNTNRSYLRGDYVGNTHLFGVGDVDLGNQAFYRPEDIPERLTNKTILYAHLKVANNDYFVTNNADFPKTASSARFTTDGRPVVFAHGRGTMYITVDGHSRLMAPHQLVGRATAKGDIVGWRPW